MAEGDIVPVPGAHSGGHLGIGDPGRFTGDDSESAQRMMDAEWRYGAASECREVSPDRVNSRSGCRRGLDTRAGTIELAIPKLRQEYYIPAFLEHWRRAERALASVVAMIGGPSCRSGQSGRDIPGPGTRARALPPLP